MKRCTVGLCLDSPPPSALLLHTALTAIGLPDCRRLVKLMLPSWLISIYFLALVVGLLFLLKQHYSNLFYNHVLTNIDFTNVARLAFFKSTSISAYVDHVWKLTIVTIDIKKLIFF